MTDLGFALDGLYACGYWPSDRDPCLQHNDGRWYPAESTILAFFAESMMFPQIHESSAADSVEVHWSSSMRGRQVVHGRSREEALLLAFTSLYLETHAQLTRY